MLFKLISAPPRNFTIGLYISAGFMVIKKHGIPFSIIRPQISFRIVTRDADVPGTFDVTIFTCFIKFKTFCSSAVLAVIESPLDICSVTTCTVSGDTEAKLEATELKLAFLTLRLVCKRTALLWRILNAVNMKE